MTVSQHRQEERGSGWFNPKVDAGHIMQAIVLLVASLAWLLVSRSDVDTAKGDIKDVKRDMTSGFKEIGLSQEKMRQELLAKIENNPNSDRHFNDIEKWISATEAYRTAHETRISEIERQDARMRADLDAILRASNAPIRNAR